MILKGPHFSKLSLASSKSEQEWKFEERMFYSFFFFFTFYILLFFLCFPCHVVIVTIFQNTHYPFPHGLRFQANFTFKKL